MAPDFKNRPNRQLQHSNGDVVFDSRSLAVLAMVIAYDAPSEKFFALVGRRGAAVDHSGLWCMVCGYLDWDETLADAVKREVYEESGLDLIALEAKGEFAMPDQPAHVSSDVSDHRQNVTARFVVPLRRRHPVHSHNAEAGEVDTVEWLELRRESIAERAWAFEHGRLLEDCADWYAAAANKGGVDATSTLVLERAMREGRVG